MGFFSGNITFAEAQEGRPWVTEHIMDAPSLSALTTYANGLLAYSAAKLINISFIETVLLDHSGTYTDWKDVQKSARINVVRSPLSGVRADDYRQIVIRAPHLSLFENNLVKRDKGDEIAALYSAFRGVTFVFTRGTFSDF